MQPVRYDLTVQAGDTTDLLFRVRTKVDGHLVPFVIADGEAVVFAIRWTGGTIVASTGDSGPSGLAVAVEDDATTLRRRLTAVETKRIPLGRIAGVTLARVPAADERKTWLTGLVIAQSVPLPGSGDVAADLLVNDTAVEVSLTVDDAAQANTLAVIRAEMDLVAPPTFDFSRPAMMGSAQFLLLGA